MSDLIMLNRAAVVAILDGARCYRDDLADGLADGTYDDGAETVASLDAAIDEIREFFARAECERLLWRRTTEVGGNGEAPGAEYFWNGRESRRVDAATWQELCRVLGIADGTTLTD